MIIENNYILIKKEVKKAVNDSENKHRKVTTEDLIEIRKDKRERSIKENLSTCFNIEEDEWQKEIKYSVTKKIENTDSNITFEVFEIGKNNYLNVKAEAKQESQCIDSMEFIHNKINDDNSKFTKYYKIINTYDSISEFYCNKIFYKFANFERLFRKLLFTTYIIKYSENYFNETINEEITKKAKSNIRIKNKKNKEEVYIKEFFYALDYSDLQLMLFQKTWICAEENEKNEFLSKHENLSNLSDDELRNFIDNLKPKSDWERLFKDKIQIDDIEQKINYIREKRNQIAHSRFFTKEDYQKSETVLDSLIKAVDDAINLIQDNYFLDENEDFKKAIMSIQNPLAKIDNPFKSIQVPKIPVIPVSDIIGNCIEATLPLKKIGDDMNKTFESIKKMYLNFGITNDKFK